MSRACRYHVELVGEDNKEEEVRRSKDGVGLRACQILREPLKSHGWTIYFFRSQHRHESEKGRP